MLPYRVLIRARRRVDVILPAVFGMILMVALFKLLYSGNQRDRLASQIERDMIHRIVAVTGHLLPDPKHVQAISETPEDLEAWGSVAGDFKGLGLQYYVEVVRKVLKAQPRLIVLSWMPAVYGTDPRFLGDVLDLIQEQHAVDILIPYPLFETEDLPAQLQNYPLLLEGDDCGFDVQVVCAYEKEWGRWIIQALAQRLGEQDSIASTYLREQFVHNRPVYIAQVVHPDRIPRFSFAQALSATEDLSFLKDKVVLIGSEVHQPIYHDVDSSFARRVRGIYDSSDIHLSRATPMHLWWAGLSEMLMTGSMIAIAPLWLVHALTLLVIVLLCWCWVRLPWWFAVQTYIGLVILMILGNMVAVAFFSFYFPMFDIGFGALLLTVTGLFGRLSLQLRSRVHQRERRQRLDEMTRLKVNFLSMISHNLNTPIAQLQGLADLLEYSQSSQEGNDRTGIVFVAQLRSSIAKMQLAARSVLGRSSTDTAALVRTLNGFQIAEDLSAHLNAPLKALQIQAELMAPDPQSEEFYQTADLDTKLLASTVLAALFVDQCMRGEKDRGLHQSSYRVDLLPKDDGFGIELSPFACRAWEWIIGNQEVSPLIEGGRGDKANDAHGDQQLLEILSPFWSFVFANPNVRLKFKNSESGQGCLGIYV